MRAGPSTPLLLGVLALAASCGGKGGGGSPGPSDAGQGSTGVVMQKVVAPEAGQLYHGVFPAAQSPQPDSDVSPEALDGYEQAAGRSVAYVYFDDEWLTSRAFPAQTAGWIRAHGSVPFIRLMLRTKKGQLVVDPVFTLDRINAGEFDSDLAAWADQARAFGTPLLVEYGTEVNGDWNPWSAPYNGGIEVAPAKFKAAYRRIVGVMRGRGATNITWALHYNGQNFPGDDPRNVPSAYYPGDDVVDWVGISVYGSERSNDHRCNSFRSLVDDMLPQLRAATATKPLFIFEFGMTTGNPACAAGPWVQAAFDDLLSGRWDLRGFSWWQQKFADDPSIGGITDYLLQDDPQIAAAFRASVVSPKVLDHPLVR